jgi:hypothetical protein
MSEMLIRIKVKLQESQNGAVEGRVLLTMEAWRLKMEPWRVCRQVIAHFDEEQDPDRIEVKSGIRIRIKVINRIRIEVKRRDPDPH